MGLKPVKPNQQGDLFIPDLEQFVKKDCIYRSLKNLIDFDKLAKPLEKLYSSLGREGYPVGVGLKCLLIQYLEDLSDRELEQHLCYHIGAKYFCGFSLGETTPDHTYFCVLRKRIGTSELAKLFNAVRDALKRAGFIREVFSFVDASAIDACVDSWKARDKAKQLREQRKKERKIDPDSEKLLSNKNISDFSSDPDARFGCKGKDHFWLGYKKTVSVDMTLGLITKVAVTSANVPDAQALRHVCPKSGMVFMDKGYSSKKVRATLTARGCASGVVLKNNMKEKNHDLDRWRTRVRMPFEGVFSRLNGSSRYRGLVKGQFQAFMESLTHNLLTAVASGIKHIALSG